MTLVVLEVEQFPKVLNFSGSVCQKPAAVVEGSSALTCSPWREERPKCRTNLHRKNIHFLWAREESVDS